MAPTSSIIIKKLDKAMYDGLKGLGSNDEIPYYRPYLIKGLFEKKYGIKWDDFIKEWWKIPDFYYSHKI